MVKRLEKAAMDQAMLKRIETEEESSDKITIYPNPVRHLLQISSSAGSSFQLKLYNNKGQVVIQANETSTIDCSRLMHGIYFLKVIDNQSGQIVVKKVLVGN